MRQGCWLVAAAVVISCLTSCSHAGESKQGAPIVWIIYEGQRYEGAQIYPSQPEGLVSTHTVTDGDDFVPRLEIFSDATGLVLYVKEGIEWMRFERVE